MNTSTHLRFCCRYLVCCVMTFLMPFTSQGSRQSITHKEIFNTEELSIEHIISPSGDGTFSRLAWGKMYHTGSVGQPELLVKHIGFLVPDNAYDFSLEIQNSVIARSITLEYPLYPVQEAKSTNENDSNEFTPPDESTYFSLISNKEAEIIEESRPEGRYHIVTVALYPILYNPENNDLTIYNSMQITLSYNEILKTERQTTTQKERHKGLINISDFIVNPEDLSSDIFRSISPNPNGNVAPMRYYIISERKLLPALDDLVLWKRQKGYTVVTKAIEDIYADAKYKVNSTTEIVDEAASLRRYLSDEFDKYDTFFCFLVGDHKTKMPIRKLRRANSKDTISTGNNYIPTDNYFSDLSENGWTLFKDGSGQYVCDMEKTQYEPYIYVGRLLCHTPEQIENYISKLILYEANPGRGNASYLDNTTLTVQYDGRSYYQDVLKSMQSTFSNVDCMLDILISDKTKSRYPTGKMMLQSINKSGYSSLMGHSEPSSIACSGEHDWPKRWSIITALDSYLFISETEGDTRIESDNMNDNGLDLMNNYDTPSVIYTIGCTTSPFDIYREDGFVYDLPHTMSSSYTVGGKYGGVAFLGNTRKGFWDNSSELEQLFLESVNKYPKIGIAEAISKYSYKPGSNSSIAKYRSHVRHTHNLIGDPEFEMWKKSPVSMDLDMRWHDSGISVTGADLNGSRVVLNDGEGNIRVIDCNMISPSLSYIRPGDSMEAISVFKTGFLPIVTLKCQNSNLLNVNKSFIVRNAELGANIDTGRTYGNVVIGSKTQIEISAVDSINCSEGLKITSDGNLILNCDKKVNMEGCEISDSGNVTVNSETVKLSKGFKVSKGGTLTIHRK